MTGTSIQLKDTRLLLFQALERGSFEGSFFEKLEKDGAGMSYEFARKYYKVTFEAHLILASYCVLGIINVGLIILSNDDVDLAVKILKTKSLIEIFQAGWRQIANLAELEFRKKEKGSLSAVEKDFAERVSADPATIWIGQSELEKSRLELTDWQNEKALQQLLLKQYWKDADRGPLQEGIFKQDNISVIRTIFMSLLISDQPIVPLKIEDIPLVIKALTVKPDRKKLRRKILALPDIPKHLDIYLRQEIKDFFKYLSGLDKTRQEEGEKEMIDYLYSRLFIKADPDHISRQRYLSTLHGLDKGGPPSATILSIEVSRLTETADVSEKLAIIDYAIKYFKRLKPEDIIYLVEKGEDLWQKKIHWERVNTGVFTILMESSAREKIMADIFLQQKQNAMVNLLSKLPSSLLVSMMNGLDSYRDFLLENVKKSGARFDSLKADLDATVMFVPVKEWLEMWRLMDPTHMEQLFSMLIDSYRKSGLKPQKIKKLVFERVVLLAKALRDNPDLVALKCKAPFYEGLLRKSVHDALSDKEYRELRQELTKALKE